MNRQKALAAFAADYGVHMHNCSIWILLNEFFERLKVSADVAALVNFKLGFLISFPEFHFSWKINVSHIEEAGVYIVVDGFLAALESICIVCTNLVN